LYVQRAAHNRIDRRKTFLELWRKEFSSIGSATLLAHEFAVNMTVCTGAAGLANTSGAPRC